MRAGLDYLNLVNHSIAVFLQSKEKLVALCLFLDALVIVRALNADSQIINVCAI